MSQLATVKIKFDGDIKPIPVFSLGESGSNVYEILRVKANNQIGFIPLTDPSNSPYPKMKIETQKGLLAFNDSKNTTTQPNGTFFYVTDSNNDNKIYQYEASTTYDISTFSFFTKIDYQEELGSNPTPTEAFATNKNVSKIYLGQGTNDTTVYEYDLGINKNISSLNFNQKNNFNTTEDSLGSYLFDDDGSNLIISQGDASGQPIFEDFNLSTNFNVSSFTKTNDNKRLSDLSARFNDNGEKLYTEVAMDMDQYSLSTAFKVDTASQSKTLLNDVNKDLTNVNYNGTDVSDFFWNSDGSKLYFSDTNALITSYNVTNNFDIGDITKNNEFNLSNISDISGVKDIMWDHFPKY